ncbi:histidine phosphatase family protein [Mariprofundus sp. EBB-1]|uniref:histidine phosphatase family protein n=1 Tax=Mariprofundus sp. EBB-1 TaxID=2650971 RepID=UPI000EF1E3A3|nr:histidine phosphatase family protein [Mariprofundus sp. EBB-1]RLL55606.1 histidine phosphatase family protein [Mariprofundus sp. EBB-1]
MLTIDVLRHGALQGGIKYRGQIEAELTSQGRLAMDQVWQPLSEQVECIITSPLSRCATAATDWAKRADIPCIIEPRIAEMHYGAWEDKTIEEIEQISPGLIQQWRQDPTGMRPPGGESPEELRERIAEWWQETTSNMTDGHILVVGHSGSMRMLIAHALNLPIAATRDMHMPYASWKRLQHDQTTTRLIPVTPA